MCKCKRPIPYFVFLSLVSPVMLLYSSPFVYSVGEVKTWRFMRSLLIGVLVLSFHLMKDFSTSDRNWTCIIRTSSWQQLFHVLQIFFMIHGLLPWQSVLYASAFSPCCQAQLWRCISCIDINNVNLSCFYEIHHAKRTFIPIMSEPISSSSV